MQGWHIPRLTALCLFVSLAAAAEQKTVHTVFTTECSTYFNWQVSVLLFALASCCRMHAYMLR